MKYNIQFEAEDLAEVIQKLSSCTDVKLLSFGPAEQLKTVAKRPVLGRNPRIKTPAQLSGQAAFTYSLFSDKPLRQIDLVEAFAKQYPHLVNPFNSLSPLIRTLAARGFIIKDSSGGYIQVKFE